MPAPLALIPLDSRPVCLDAPVMLAAVAGETLLTPPRTALGRFLQPGDPETVAAWLWETAPRARAIIVALDMLAYGGLVASRTPAVSAAHALERLEVLRAVKQAYPHLRLPAFNVIMRLTITGSDQETRAAGRDIFRYSVLRDQAERLGDAGALAELADVEARIPPTLLDAYLAARARNHAVNRAALDLLADGVLDFLALVQEDTAPAGLHVAEQQALLAHGHAVADRWRLYAGTDEAAQTLLAREVAREAEIALPVHICLRDAAAAEHPALFEDVPLRETITRHVEAVGGRFADHGLTLAVHTFTPPQPDLFEMPALPSPTWEAALSAFPATGAAAWYDALPTGPRAVADLAYCNGGDPHLLDALLARGLDEVESYAGWNTAGNTLGTTLAHAALRTVARARGLNPALDDAHRRALLVRLLDDGLYQPIVRAWAMARVQELGASPLNLGEMTVTVAQWVDDAMHALWREVCARYPAAASLNRPFTTALPWGRLFEIRIEMDNSVF